MFQGAKLAIFIDIARTLKVWDEIWKRYWWFDCFVANFNKF